MFFLALADNDRTVFKENFVTGHWQKKREFAVVLFLTDIVQVEVEGAAFNQDAVYFSVKD